MNSQKGLTITHAIIGMLISSILGVMSLAHLRNKMQTYYFTHQSFTEKTNLRSCFRLIQQKQEGRLLLSGVPLFRWFDSLNNTHAKELLTLLGIHSKLNQGPILFYIHPHTSLITKKKIISLNTKAPHYKYSSNLKLFPNGFMLSLDSKPFQKKVRLTYSFKPPTSELFQEKLARIFPVQDVGLLGNIDKQISSFSLISRRKGNACDKNIHLTRSNGVCSLSINENTKMEFDCNNQTLSISNRLETLSALPEYLYE